LYHPLAEGSTSSAPGGASRAAWRLAWRGWPGSDRLTWGWISERIKVNNDNRLIGLWVAVAVLLGLFVGAAAAVIAWSDGHHAAAAMLAGGDACGGTITLCVLIINTLRSR
jgi:hypothetical protein